jgi:hypothetical protein
MTISISIAQLRGYMSDNEMVASIVAGDPGGLAEAYDRYADVVLVRERLVSQTAPPEPQGTAARRMRG